MTVSFDPSLILSWYQAKANLAGLALGGGAGPSAASAARVPTAPWNNPALIPKDSALVSAALSGRPFIDEKAAKVDVPNADADYKKLFAINQGLLTLQALADAANDPKTSSFQLPSIQAAFNRGMTELAAYVQAAKFDNFRLTEGVATASATSVAGVATASDSYTTPVLATGSADSPAAAFKGSVQFSADVKRVSGTVVTVNFDLSEMGATPRTMNSVAAYINGKLQAAGVGVRVSVDKTQTDPETVTVNGVTTTIAPAQTDLALKVSGLSAETVTFSAPATQPTVYVAQTAGSTDPNSDGKTDDADQQQELVKFEAGSGADAFRRPGDANYAAGRIFSEKLPEGVGAVHQTVTGADGSVYVIADATATVAGQPIKGVQDAVLLKYDSAGTLVYTRTLGAGVTASGLSLAVSADGKVAIAGSVTGELDSGDAGADPTQSDSVVTLFDSQGQELWTQRQGATGADQAQAVAFDAAGDVLVAGKTQGSIGGGTAVGATDAYLRAFSSSGAVLSTRQFGSGSDDSVGGIVVDGANVYVATQEGGQAVLRSFDASDPRQLAQTASRNLGGLGGGLIGGLGLDGAGNLLIGGATGANLNLSNVTLARGGALDGFGARISTDLTSTASDAVAYYGGAGADQVTAATVAGGQVWVTGTSKTALPGLNPVGSQDGFVAGLDVGAGQVTYSQRFTAKDRTDAPEAIGVDTTGGSALDVLGLPRGTLRYGDSTLITAATSARAGDQFQIKMGSSSLATTITIEAGDTLDSLAAKIRSAGFFEIAVTTLSNGTSTQLQLKPASDRVTFQLLPGPAGRNALDSLGLTAGLIRNTVVDKTKGVLPADRGKQTYGLRLDAELAINSKAAIKGALDSLTNAITTVRAIYADLKQAATPKNPLASIGDAPAYLKNRIADYQAALDRLSSGDGSLASLLG